MREAERKKRKEGKKDGFARAYLFLPDNKQILKIIFWVKGFNFVV